MKQFISKIPVVLDWCLDLVRRRYELGKLGEKSESARKEVEDLLERYNQFLLKNGLRENSTAPALPILSEAHLNHKRLTDRVLRRLSAVLSKEEASHQDVRDAFPEEARETIFNVVMAEAATNPDKKATLFERCLRIPHALKIIASDIREDRIRFALQLPGDRWDLVIENSDPMKEDRYSDPFYHFLDEQTGGHDVDNVGVVVPGGPSYKVIEDIAELGGGLQFTFDLVDPENQKDIAIDIEVIPGSNPDEFRFISLTFAQAVEIINAAGFTDENMAGVIDTTGYKESDIVNFPEAMLCFDELAVLRKYNEIVYPDEDGLTEGPNETGQYILKAAFARAGIVSTINNPDGEGPPDLIYLGKAQFVKHQFIERKGRIRTMSNFVME